MFNIVIFLLAAISTCMTMELMLSIHAEKRFQTVCVMVESPDLGNAMGVVKTRQDLFSLVVRL